MRIGLIGDSHGHVPALAASIAGCRAAGVDVIVHCGDFLSAPFSPDPPSETIALLRANDVRAIPGNHEVYLRDWGTSRWDAAVTQRRQRPDSPDYFLGLIPAGQALLSADELAWLRSLPPELVLDVGRAGDVYVCHAMPGNPFSTSWDTDPKYTPDNIAAVRVAALSGSAAAEADLILCGHVPHPLVMRTALPNGRTALVVRGTGFMQDPDTSAESWWTDFVVLTRHGSVGLGHRGWSVERRVVPFEPSDRDWQWDQPTPARGKISAAE